MAKFEKTDNTKAIEQLNAAMDELGNAIMALHKRIEVLEAVTKLLAAKLAVAGNSEQLAAEADQPAVTGARPA